MNFKRNLMFVAIGLSASRSSWAAAGGSGMPWEGPLAKIALSLSGPTVASIAVIGLVVAVVVLIFGGNLPDWGKQVTVAALALSVAVGASSFILNLFGVAAGVI